MASADHITNGGAAVACTDDDTLRWCTVETALQVDLFFHVDRHFSTRDRSRRASAARPVTTRATLCIIASKGRPS